VTSDDRSWGELRWYEKALSVFTAAIGIPLTLVVLGFSLVFPYELGKTALAETRWALVSVQPSRVCTGAQHSDCLVRTRGRVQAIDGVDVDVRVERAPYVRRVRSLHGVPPAVGSAIVLEDWNGRLVSISDERGRLRTSQWPNPVRDVLEATAALTPFLIVLLLCLLGWRRYRRFNPRPPAAARQAEAP
jgi:hypothetical protein